MNDIIQTIDAQIALLQEVRSTLLGTEIKRGPGRPKANKIAKLDGMTDQPAKRKLSAEARARISAAQRQRWAKRRKAAK